MSNNVFKQALDDMQPVRQMTMEEVAILLRETVKSAPINLGSAYDAMAKALSKLGAIKVVGDV